MIDDTSRSTPEELRDRCHKLAERRNELAALDQKMIGIVSLAGTELSETNLVRDYRIAFEKTMRASDLLYQSLQSKKLSILIEGETSSLFS